MNLRTTNASRLICPSTTAKFRSVLTISKSVTRESAKVPPLQRNQYAPFSAFFGASEMWSLALRAKRLANSYVIKRLLWKGSKSIKRYLQSGVRVISSLLSRAYMISGRSLTAVLEWLKQNRLFNGGPRGACIANTAENVAGKANRYQQTLFRTKLVALPLASQSRNQGKLKRILNDLYRA